MNLKNRLILEDYRKQRDDFIRLGDVVHNMLTDIVDSMGITVLGIEHRVKTEKSLAGKLERNGDWYSSFEDLTDILGARVICFFSDEIDKIGKKVEIQIRTTLQHTWAAINHDLGYKSEFGVPRSVAREFSRIAGLLEIADDEFVRVRNDMKDYTEEIRKKIIDNKADDVHIDMISLNEYVKRNGKMQELISKIAKISNAEISEIDPESYIIQLKFLGKETLGDLQKMLEENRELALKLAERALANADLDILSSSVGLRFLCRAELLNKHYSLEKTTEFLKLSMGTAEKAQRQAKHLFRTYEKVKEECE